MFARPPVVAAWAQSSGLARLRGGNAACGLKRGTQPAVLLPLRRPLLLPLPAIIPLLPPPPPYSQRERHIADGTAGAVDTAIDFGSNAVNNIGDVVSNVISTVMDTASKARRVHSLARRWRARRQWLRWGAPREQVS